MIKFVKDWWFLIICFITAIFSIVVIDYNNTIDKNKLTNKCRSYCKDKKINFAGYSYYGGDIIKVICTDEIKTYSFYLEIK